MISYIGNKKQDTALLKIRCNHNSWGVPTGSREDLTPLFSNHYPEGVANTLIG